MADSMDDDIYAERPCKSCHQLFPQISLFDHQDMCQASPNDAASKNKTDEAELKLCPFCNENCSTKDILNHVGSCPKNMYQCPLCEKTFPVKDKGIHENFYCEVLLEIEQSKNSFDESSCRFCKELFPSIGIVEHEAFCKGQQSDAKTYNRVVEELQRKDTDLPDVEAPKNELEKASNRTQNRGKSPPINIKNEEKIKSHKRNIPIKQIEQTFMSFGIDAEIHKDLKNNTHNSSKMPSNPLLQYADQKDDMEDLNNLSDDDCEESLEDFWIRAREFLKHQKLHNV